MNPITTLIGAAALLYGIYTFYLRATNPAKFGKLEAMKEQWGETAGYAIHVLAYSIVPILFGVVMLMRGLEGGSLF